MEEKSHAKNKSDNRLDHESKIKNGSYYWRAPPNYRKEEFSEGIQIRDLFSDIPYVDDTSWAIKCDPNLGVIHIRPSKLKKEQTFTFDGTKYLLYQSEYGMSMFIVGKTWNDD